MYLAKSRYSFDWFRVVFLAPLLLAASCANVATTKVELDSLPAGAEVKTLDGTSLGVTPLVLSGEALRRVSQKGRMTVSLWTPGYLERECVLDVHGDDTHEVRLTKLNEDFFAKRFTLDFARPANQLVRQLLVARELIQMRKLEEAEKTLLAFQQTFPNVAASYVMLADIELIRGRSAEARQYLVKAQSIDPSDTEVARLLLRGTNPGGMQ